MNDITYSHEHMMIDLSQGKGDPDCYLNVYEEAMEELYQLKALGVRRIVDCSNRGIGRNWDIDRRIQEETGIEIVRSTGFYKDPFLPDCVREWPVEKLAKLLVDDIERGARVLGEIGSSLGVITPDEKKVFEAACVAQKETNAIVITHTTLGTMHKEQMDLFKKFQVNPKKVIISHLDLKNDLSVLVETLNEGFYVAFDTIGKTRYLPDETRAQFIRTLCDKRYEGQILLSMDLTRQSHLKKNGGVGYAYLLEEFVPLLQSYGVSQTALEEMLCHNFNKILEEPA